MSRRVVFFLLPFFLVAFYFSAVLYGIPALVKGPLAEKLAAALGRPVRIGQVVVSPLDWQVQVSGIIVGSARGELPYLLKLESLQCRPSASLRTGKIILHDLLLDGPDLQLIRYREGEYNFSDLVPALRGLERRGGLAPVSVDRIQVRNGRLTLDDRPVQARHRVRDLQILLPLGGGGSGQDMVLRAVVNDSPVEVTGSLDGNGGKGRGNRLRLGLHGLELRSYAGYIPGLQQIFAVEEGSADLDVELVLAGGALPGKSLSLEGDLVLRNVRAVSRDNMIGLELPGGRLAFSVQPLAGAFSFEEMVFRQGTLRYQGNDPALLLGSLGQLVGNPALKLQVDRLLVEEGTLWLQAGDGARSATPWEAVRLQLTGWRSRAALTGGESGPVGVLRLSAEKKGEKKSFSFQGTLDQELFFDGEADLANVDGGWLLGLLRPGNRVGAVRGRGDFSGRVSYRVTPGSRPGLELKKGSLELRDFQLVDGTEHVLSGRKLVCEDLQADGQAGCARLTLVGADIDATGFLAFLGGEDKGEGAFLQMDELAVEDSRLNVRLPIPGDRDKTYPLTISRLMLQATGLRDPERDRDNIILSGIVGRRAELRMGGVVSLAPARTTARLQVSLRNLSLEELRPLIRPWFLPEKVSGQLHLRGSLSWPGKQYEGIVWLEQFAAADRDGLPLLSWDRGVLQGVHLSFAPFGLSMDNVQLQRPRLLAGNGPAGLVRFINPRWDIGYLPVSIGHLSVENGTFQAGRPALFPDYVPELTGLQGTVTSIRHDGVFPFTFSGRLEEARVELTGSATLGSTEEYHVSVSDFPLYGFTDFFTSNLGAEVRLAMADWTVDGDGEGSVATVHLEGVRVLPDSRYGLIFALLLDQQGSLGLELGPLKGRDELLFPLVHQHLHRLLLQAVISPWLIVESEFPDLHLEREIVFPPARAEMDFPDPGDYGRLLEKRPLLGLRITGGYDPETDLYGLQEVLQEQADQQWQEENRRRELLRLQWLAREKEAIAAIGKTGQVQEELIEPDWKEHDLQPLPRPVVEVPPGQLVELARKRARAVAAYLVEKAGLPGERVDVDEQILQSGAVVKIGLVPMIR
ncbi:flagellar motor protein MotB [Desulfolithobacter dissulfuricans]|uniref:Flagellar motor protein MotB n=1 Tax=Desulfolithobacter dissulfuricans TaxID=2795293 RepID=A0A915U4U4_9BACT|nr:flagellar motor protein MotB [Desulfolithobacter dissulfuricans]